MSDLPDWVRSYLHLERCLSDKHIALFRIGYSEEKRALTFPVPTTGGGQLTRYRSLVSYDPQTGKSTHNNARKMWWSEKPPEWENEPTPPFPSWNDWRDPDTEVIVEGEFDAMVAMAHNILAVSGTLGSSAFSDTWISAITGQTRVILYDYDGPGLAGAQKLAAALSKGGCRVLVATWPGSSPVGFDMTEHFRTGGSTEAVRDILAAAVPYQPFRSKASDDDRVRAINRHGPPSTYGTPEYDPYEISGDGFDPEPVAIAHGEKVPATVRIAGRGAVLPRR